MTKRIKSIFCTVIVIAIIISMLTVANAGTTGYFTNRQVNSSNYRWLVSSEKSTTSATGTAVISEVKGDNYATIRGGTSTNSAYSYGVSSGSTVYVTLKYPYTIKGDAIGLYGQGLGYTYMLTGSWNAN